MIAAVGVEWVDVERFEAARRRFGDRLDERLFTAAERAYASQRRRSGGQSLAVRFAAKAAARRALRAAPTPFGAAGAEGRPGASVAWRDVEVVRERGRAPTLRFHGSAARAARALGVGRVALTLTHDALFCVGQVVLETAPPGTPGMERGRNATGKEPS